MGFFNKGETRADLKCVGKHPSESDKLTINTIDVINTSIQSFTKPVGIGSKSDDLHGAGLSQITCTELTGQDDAPQHQLHETDCVGPLWCLEESTHLSMSQRGKKTE